jgi:hypothetical protein
MEAGAWDEAEDSEKPKLRSLVWLRNTRGNVQAFPAGARKEATDLAAHEQDNEKQ